MSKAGSLTVCYASQESGGNKDGDYVALGIRFVQQEPLVFTPGRTVYGAAQKLAITYGLDGDQVTFTQVVNCVDSYTSGGVSTFRTATYQLTATATVSTTQDVTLHRAAAVGVWYVCYKPSGGLQTAVVGKSFMIVMKPVFSPAVGIAGSITALTFTNMTAGDMLVLLEGDCSNPIPTKAGVASKPLTVFTNLSSGRSSWQTELSMTKPATLTLCFATAPASAPFVKIMRVMRQDILRRHIHANLERALLRPVRHLLPLQKEE